MPAGTQITPLSKLQKTLSKEILLISNQQMVRYFCSIPPLLMTEREALILVSRTNITIFHSSFLSLKKNSLYEYVPSISFQSISNNIQSLITSSKIDNQVLLFDENNLTVAEHSILAAIKNCTLMPFDQTQLWNVRMVKSPHEIKLISKAAKITNKVLSQTIDSLQTGISEKQLQESIDENFRKAGADGPAFPTIVAFGSHISSPHHQPGGQKLKINSPVLIDCGAAFKGYNSDMTRTVWFGPKPSKLFLEIEKIVKNAYQKGIDQAYSGKTASDLDTAVREEIAKHKREHQFIHTSGHGIGIEVHEPPSLYKTRSTKLAENMVVTIEPGIYIPNKIGYRHEDTFVITKKTPKNLTA